MWVARVADASYSSHDVDFQTNQGETLVKATEISHVHVLPRHEDDGLPQCFTGQKTGHCNTVGKPKTSTAWEGDHSTCD